jgi:hypothetical protein
MDLFDISSEESKNALLEYATDIFGESSIYDTRAVMQVKGRDFENCQYIHNIDGPFRAEWQIYHGYFGAIYSFCGYNLNPTKVAGSNFKRKFII